MADIKQAAKWMEEGRKVIRVQWKEDGEDDPITAKRRNFALVSPYGCAPKLTTHDLLSEDWEIAE